MAMGIPRALFPSLSWAPSRSLTERGWGLRLKAFRLLAKVVGSDGPGLCPVLNVAAYVGLNGWGLPSVGLGA